MTQGSGGAARGSAHCGLCVPLRGRGRVGSVAVWRGRLGRSLPVAIAARGGFAAFTLDAGSSLGGYLQAAWVGHSWHDRPN